MHEDREAAAGEHRCRAHVGAAAAAVLRNLGHEMSKHTVSGRDVHLRYTQDCKRVF